MLLLDTCTLLWLVGDQARLSAVAREMFRAHTGSAFVSAISAFEIGVKHRRGKLILPKDPGQWVDDACRLHSLLEVPVSIQIAMRSTQLPLLHADPCDR